MDAPDKPTDMKIICLDAEFADNEELLELSVFSLEGREVYHSYYRPEHISDWRTDIHHITPEMVADEPTFAEKREEVAALIHNAYAVTGFAVGNDLRVLERSGIEGLDKIRVLDVKDMFWYLRGRQTDMNPFSVPSLIICAQELGLDFGEATAHSASADTEATLKCFDILFQEFSASEGAGLEEEAAFLKLGERVEEERGRFVEQSASGYVRVVKVGDAYKLKFGHQPDPEGRGIVAEVAVADRYKAEYELKKMLKKKEVPGKINLYKLGVKQLDDIRRYTNTYDAEESAWCKKIVRNLGRLSL